MEYFMVPTQKVPSLQHFRKTEKEVIGGLCSLANIPLTPETQRDQERRIRREIANSNERRRMQSINAGFQSLKTLIPHTDGEKLSKVGEAQKDFLEEVGGWSREIQETLSAGVPDLSLLPSGSHSPADCGIHLLPGAGEDPAPAAEHTAQALYPGAERLVPQAAAGRGQG
uniref:Transcription factor AP-4 n=1 Tax=Sus scrofa TaxID=9823 RepID=A0A8D0U810_PIG